MNLNTKTGQERSELHWKYINGVRQPVTKNLVMIPTIWQLFADTIVYSSPSVQKL